MQFNGRELQAILKMANAMVMADGRVDENEIRINGKSLNYSLC